MITRLPTEDYVVTDRGGTIENRYSVHAAIVDTTGKILYAVGNPYRVTLHRSAAKPAQALAVLETPGFDQYGFNDADVALMCASHNSEDYHVKRAREMLAKVGAEEHHLRCGGHPSISDVVNRTWIKNDFVPTAICNNCSGKHAGMLGGARALGAELNEYHSATNPMQLKVKQVVQELSGLESSEIQWGIDGCNLPAPASSLHALARTYAYFAEASSTVESGQQCSERERHASRVFEAMSRYPEMVGGDDRFCTELMASFNGSLIGKIGADGCYGIGIKPSDVTRAIGAPGAIGVAIKIEDGNLNILYSAVAEVLEQLQIGTSKERGALSKYHRQQITNTAGVVTGHVSHSFEVRPFGSP